MSESGQESQAEEYVHRMGWVIGGEPNTPEQAVESFKEGVVGVEMDLRLLKTGELVVGHKPAGDMTKEEYFKENPQGITFESWCKWFKERPELADKKMYLDLKDSNIDSFRLAQLVKDFGDRVVIGAKYPDTVVQLMVAKKLFGAEFKVALQIPDPAIPEVAINYANNIAEIAGLDMNNLPEWLSKDDLKPDAVHYFFNKNIVTDVKAEKAGHGEYIADKKRAGDMQIKHSGNIPIAYEMQQKRTEEFIRLGNESNFLVIAGSDEDPKTNERLIKAGVGILMPNNAKIKAEGVKRSDDKREFVLPAKRDEATWNMAEGDLRKEYDQLLFDQKDKYGPLASDINTKRGWYLYLVTKLKNPDSLTMQIGTAGMGEWAVNKFKAKIQNAIERIRANWKS